MHGFSLMSFVFIVHSQDISGDFSCTPFLSIGFLSGRLSPSIDFGLCSFSPLSPPPSSLRVWVCTLETVFM